MRDDTMTLPDGRALAFAEWTEGDTNVLFLSGGPGSRLHCPDAAAALDRGIRLITLDRPGYGASDPKPCRTLSEWPSDASALADSLGMTSFSVIGWSGGGPHALVCGALMPDRVRRIVLVASPGPTDEVPGVMETDFQRKLVYDGVLDDRAQTEEMVVAFLAAQVADPEAYVDAMIAASPDDTMRGNADWSANLRQGVLEALRQGAVGLAGDAISGYGPWGFGLKDVKQHVSVCHGTADTIVSPSHAEYLAAALPDATLHAWDGEGHGCLYPRWGKILDLAV